jgi:hypothetical protein
MKGGGSALLSPLLTRRNRLEFKPLHADELG